MRKAPIILLLSALSGCSALQDPVSLRVDRVGVLEYANYCGAAPASSAITAYTYAQSGFAFVEQQCGIFFDNITELTRAGRFSQKALNSSNIAAHSILQAAKVAAETITIVGTSIALAEALFNAFVEQYAFAPYLYKIQELAWQAFDKHKTDNDLLIKALATRSAPDDYCMAHILVQAHARICTIANLQALFDQQVANATKLVKPEDKADEKRTGEAVGRTSGAVARRLSTRRGLEVVPANRPLYSPVTPSFTVH